MDFLKKHYEKILLGVMLAGLIGVLVFMLFYIAADTEDMNDKAGSADQSPGPCADRTWIPRAWTARMLRSKSPYDLDFETTNKLFNPMEWQKTLDGT